MHVVGGYYSEVCIQPEIREHFGSGGRAAVALASTGIDVHWHYFCPPQLQEDAQVILSTPSLTHIPYSSSELVSFRYFHPLSRPAYSPAEIGEAKSIEVNGEHILRFGMMEGGARVFGQYVVYDPQSPKKPIPFGQNGSSAEHLGVVLNVREALALGRAGSEGEAIETIFAEQRPDIIVVKSGAEGCRVYEPRGLAGTVPAYQTDYVYKIGSGDIFSASFFFNWAFQKKPPMIAADCASKSAAIYCGTRALSVIPDSISGELVPVNFTNPKGLIYLAGPFFTMAEVWLVEECWNVFSDLNVEFFSPYHHVGLGPPEKVVKPDLEALDKSCAVLAIIDGCDPGTLFEIGYAVKKGIPVVAFSQNPKEGDLTMLQGSPLCTITNDFAGAIYQAIWKACA